MFKLLNNIAYIPDDCKQIYAANGFTRASNSVQLTRPYARINIYLHLFLYRLFIINIQYNVTVEEFKDFYLNLL